jgi:hypothetical protein
VLLGGCISGDDALEQTRPPYTEDEFAARVAAAERLLGEKVPDQRARDDLIAGGSREAPHHECDQASLSPERVDMEANLFGVTSFMLVIQLARCGDAALAAYEPLIQREGPADAFAEFVSIEQAMDEAVGE